MRICPSVLPGRYEYAAIVGRLFLMALAGQADSTQPGLLHRPPHSNANGRTAGASNYGSGFGLRQLNPRYGVSTLQRLLPLSTF